MSTDRIGARVGLLALGVFAADQAAKAVVRTTIERGDAVGLLLGADLVNVRNDGIAFGLFGGSTVLVLAVTLLAALGLAYYVMTQPRRRGQWVAVGLLAGGAAGNLVDRVAAGEVTDFIDLPAWPAFNLADVAITVGIATLIATELLAELRDRGDP